MKVPCHRNDTAASIQERRQEPHCSNGSRRKTIKIRRQATAFYLKTDPKYGFRLVLGYETQDGTRVEIYEERRFASWHLTVLRSGEEFARECRCVSCKHAYSLLRKTVEMYDGNHLPKQASGLIC